MILLFFYFLLGFTFGFPAVALQFYLMEDKEMSPPAMAALMGIISIPWCFKPLIGLFSDMVPIRGLHRKPYIIIGLLMAGVAWWIMPYTDDGLGLMLFLSSFGLCIADVACDCLLVVAARGESEEDKGSVQSYAWGLRATGGLLASVLGPISYKTIGPELTFCITGCIPILFATTIQLLQEERKVVTNETKEKNPLKTLFEAFRKPKLWQPALFIIILNVTPGYGTVLSYFFERVLKFTPYNFAMLDVAGSISAIAGTFLYKRFLTGVPLRKLFFWTIFSAWTLRWLHVVLITRIVPSIDLIFAICESVALTLVSQAILLPTVVLVAKLTPKGIEGSTYATYMSLSNMAGVVGTEWGATMAAAMEIDRDNFDNLLKLAILCNIIGAVPLFSTRLVRDSKQEAEVEAEETETEAGEA
jgi:Na+/melibiose symporter-like transporter